MYIIFLAPYGHPLRYPMFQEGPNLSAVRFTKAQGPATAPTTAPPTEPLNLDSATRQLEQLVQVWSFTWETMENSREEKKCHHFSIGGLNPLKAATFWETGEPSSMAYEYDGMLMHLMPCFRS